MAGTNPVVPFFAAAVVGATAAYYVASQRRHLREPGTRYALHPREPKNPSIYPGPRTREEQGPIFSSQRVKIWDERATVIWSESKNVYLRYDRYQGKQPIASMRTKIFNAPAGYMLGEEGIELWDTNSEFRRRLKARASHYNLSIFIRHGDQVEVLFPKRDSYRFKMSPPGVR